MWEEIIILCIGSDRITGDSLGPLIGHQLSKCRWRNIRIYGTLDYPVHALNLEATLDKIKRRHPSSLLIAVDASLGSKKHVGFNHGGLRRALSRRRGTQGPPQRGGYFHHRDFERIRYL